MKESYRYLFPFERVPPGAKVLIYGAGEMGRAYLEQVLLTRYCHIVAMADKNFYKYKSMVVPVIDPCQIHRFKFDYVILAIRVAVAYSEMHRILEAQGIEEEKIVCIYERSQVGTELFASQLEVTSEERQDGTLPAFVQRHKDAVTIACLIVGGLGDHVIQKRFLTELMGLASNALIDIYAIRHVPFLRYLFSDCEQVHAVIDDLGVMYERNKEKYMLAMAVEACHYVRVDVFEREAVGEVAPELAEKVKGLKKAVEEDFINLSTPVHVSIMRRMYQGCNVYSGFEYRGVFEIADKKVSIPLSSQGEAFWTSLHLERYVTVNYGSGECRDGSRVAKMWPLDRFSEVVAKLKRRYPDIIVVQLGDKNADKIDGVDLYIFGKKLEYVASILKHALFHLDIEGGLVHIATQLKTKCVVLFGPTLEAYYGYDENINIRAGRCGGCFGLYSDINKCARAMEKPECMYAITPDLVIEKIEAYMEKIG